MQAYQLVEWQQAPELRDVDVPEPGPGEVLIKVGGAGACHSDLHVMEWPAGTLPYELPFTLGHENAGWIEAVGPGVTGWDLGAGGRRLRAVGLRALPGVSHARWRRCASAEREIGAAGGGLGRDGGMAEYMLVPGHPLARAARRPRPARRRAALRRCPDALPRPQARACEARARHVGPRDRRRRPRPHGRAARARDRPRPT